MKRTRKTGTIGWLALCFAVSVVLGDLALDELARSSYPVPVGVAP